MKKLYSKILCAVLCIAMCVSVFVMPSFALEAFTESEDYSTPLFQVASPHCSGQEFVPDSGSIAGVSLYIETSDANTAITFKILQTNDSGNITATLFEQRYNIASAYKGMYDFVFPRNVTVVAGNRYAFSVQADKSCVLHGKTSITAGCYALNSDNFQGQFTRSGTTTCFRIMSNCETLIKNTKASFALFNAASPNKSGQEFITAGGVLTNVKVYASNITDVTTATLSIMRNASTDNATTVYTKNYSLNSGDNGWVNFQMEGTVNLSPYIKYDIVISTDKTFLWWGTNGQVNSKCQSLNYDTQAYGGWVKGNNTTAFEVVTDRTALVINSIDMLPNEATYANKTAIENVYAQYEALTEAQKAKVTNIAKLNTLKADLDNIKKNTDPTKDIFEAHLSANQALYSIVASNNKAGQEFRSGYKKIKSLGVYINVNQACNITLYFTKDVISDPGIIYSQTYSFSGPFTGWYDFIISSPIDVNPVDKYTFYLQSTGSAAVFGTVKSLADADCKAVNYDNAVYGGWKRGGALVAFYLIGNERYENWELLNKRLSLIDVANLTINDENKINGYVNDYAALSPENKAKVSNYGILTSAVAKISELTAQRDAQIRTLEGKIDSLTADPADCLLFPTQMATEMSDITDGVWNLIDNYGEESIGRISNYSTLNAKRGIYRNYFETLLFGDVDNDKRITSNDALSVLRFSVEMDQLTNKQMHVGEVSGDNIVNVYDALKVLQRSIELITEFPVKKPVERAIYTENSVRVFNNTLNSLTGRIQPSGYAPTSVTGAYPGMFMRDSSDEIMALVKCGEYENARKMLNYIFKVHIDGKLPYVYHILNDSYGVISNAQQVDTTYSMIHAWCMYVNNAPESSEKTAFINYSIEKVKNFADYWFASSGTYNADLKLLRNPSLEHSRDGSYFNCYDVLTNSFASQALYEFAPIYKAYGAVSGYDSNLLIQSEALRQGINANLTATVNGKTVYAEMYAINRQVGATGEIVDVNKFIIGFSWVNLGPVAAEWYGMDANIMENTYNAYLETSTRKYYGKYSMLEATTTYSPDGTIFESSQVIGKGYAWELMYCQMTNRTDRIKELTMFYDELDTTYYFEVWTFDGYGSDAANQEHASWQVYAYQKIYGFAD